MIVIGVDPGARNTGICVVENGVVLHSETVRRDIGEHATVYGVRAGVALLSWWGTNRVPDLVGFEDINPPNPHMGMTNPGPHIETGIVLGAMWESMAGYSWGSVIVPPGGHGSHPVSFYPEQIRGVKGQRGNGEGRYIHERSAYDIAQAAPTYWAIEQAQQQIEGNK